MAQQALMTIILAAGKGTRMKSALPKVLHKVAGRSMINHVMAAAGDAGAEKQAVILGHGVEQVEKAIDRDASGVEVFIQQEQLGTAHAVLSARPALEGYSGYVIILCGDTPLLVADTLKALTVELDNGADIVALGFEAASPTGYGRLLVDANGELTAIREHKDATDEERKVTLCNSGVYAFKGQHLLGLLDRVDNNNASGEYYLPDVIEIGRNDGLSIRTATCAEEEVIGINDRVQLSQAEKIMQNRLREEAMRNGATLQDPDSVYFAYDTELGSDVIVEPHVVFAPGVKVEDNARLRGFSYFEDCTIRTGAVVGPYARIRPDSDIGENARIGNFVEVKKASVEAGAKVNHLSYIGDARVGANANIGAGTIVCNYDGFLKHHTDIGEGAFIGSNSSLVSPVKIGDNAYVGTGSVITNDVESEALALTRSEQKEKAGWVPGYRTRKKEEKEKLKKG